MGFVPTHRRGNTGIGKTLEDLLGIEENNLKIGDFGIFELKATRIDASTPITLFTKEPSRPKIGWKKIIKQYGYIDKKGRSALKFGITYGSANSFKGWYSEIDSANERINLKREDEILAYWDFDVIESPISIKMSNTVFVDAERKIVNGREHFWYNSATLAKGISLDGLLKLIRSSHIEIHLRLHLKENGSVRNRGTAFRIKEKFIPELYDELLSLLDNCGASMASTSLDEFF